MRTAADPAGFTFTYSTDNSAFRAAKAAYESSREYTVAVTTRGGRRILDRHLDRINAAAAYARGATGAGETVVIADSGFYSQHREFSGAGKFTLGASFGAPCTDAEIRSGRCSNLEHGTSTAGVAAARRAPENIRTVNMHGVAFDANIIGLRLRLRASQGPVRITGPPALTDAGDRSTVEFYERLIYRPAAGGSGYDRNNPWGFVINMSFSVMHGIDSYTRAQVREFRDRTAALFAQAHRPAADRTILVWAAGNYQGRRYSARPGESQGDPVDATSPPLENALGVHFDLPHTLAVVAVRQDGHIARFSNYCGTAKAFCIAAPGVDLISPYRGSGTINYLGIPTYSTQSYRTFSGTSAAAPVVTGALAVMRSFFKNPDGSYALGNTELVTRLLATADRTDRSATGGPDYSNSDIYGHGLLDLDAATRPVGMLMASTADGGRTPVESTSLDITGGAFGGQVSRALRDVPLALFDELDSPFFFSADRLVNEDAQREDQLAASDAATAADRMLLRAGSGDSHWWFAPKYNSGQALGGLGGLAAGDGGLAGLGDALAGDGPDARGAGGSAFLAPHTFAAPYFSLVRHGFGAGFSALAPNRG
ncbi:MAG: S8 family serine peptidase, partial [Gammaproteobacteria bacterium]|nr:S8 family serine peptidase [Gammaproteobacteria bacterium]